METQDCKKYKSRECVRNAVKKYTDKLIEQDSEKYQKWKEYHVNYSRNYYKKLKEAREKLLMIEQMNENTYDVII